MKCKNGNHDLKEIHRSLHDCIGDVDAVVRWCKECGAVVVDADRDGRTFAGRISEMKFPKIVYENLRREHE